MEKQELHFDVSSGLKRVLGRELITDDEVAVFEMVKNSFDANASVVHLYFDDDKIIVADNGDGMTYDDLKKKWLFVAYSSKRSDASNEDFRDKVASRRHYAGSKGVGRFSTDRLGDVIVLQTKANRRNARIHELKIDWSEFEIDDTRRFETVPVEHGEVDAFRLPRQLKAFGSQLSHGTIIEIGSLRHAWDREALRSLKAALAKLINPFGSATDRFTIHITVPSELDEDKRQKAIAKKDGREPSSRDLINGVVGNFIFSDLRDKTTFINVEIKDEHIISTLVDRGELIYKIRESNSYPRLNDAGFRCELYYLNHSAKLTFARRVGLPSVKFGSVFLFRNDFRVYPIGEENDDWFGIDRRKQQGFARFLGTRDVIGRVDVSGDDEDFKEASSRNQGLIDNAPVRQLQRCVMDHCLKRLERYVVPVSWADKADSKAEDISRLLTDPGRSRVSGAVAKLIDSDDIELLEYSRKLITLVNERSEGFESSLVSLRAIAEKVQDKKFIASLEAAEKRFEELKQSEAEARKIADRERAASLKASERAAKAEHEAESAREERDIERRRAHFLDALVDVDVSRIVNLHHQVTIYSVDLNQQIENLLVDTQGHKSIPRQTIVSALEQMSFLNRRIQAATKFATMANFELDSGMLETDLPKFFEEYISKVAVLSGRKATTVQVINEHPGLITRFNPMDVSIIVDNLISNAKRAGARRIVFRIYGRGEKELSITVTDNGDGLSNGVNPDRIFDMGYTTTSGSGLGLYHVRQVLGNMNGSIELDGGHEGKGISLEITISPRSSRQ